MLGHIRKRDIAGGKFLYGERIQLVQILKDEESNELERTKAIIECLHGVRPSDRGARLLHDYACDCAEALLTWLQRERKECYVSPLPQSKKAGSEALAEAIGESGNVVALAERFGFTFEQVYNMPYIDVFTIWKVDAETAKFQRRLDAVLKQEAKSKNHG